MTQSTIENVGAAHESSALHPHEALRTYYVIFAWLMGLLLLTVTASLIPFDRFAPGLNVIIALVIAIVKAALVVMFFMHVKHASKLTWAFATAAFLWLAIMLALTFNDYATRRSLPGAPDEHPPASRIVAVRSPSQE